MAGLRPTPWEWVAVVAFYAAVHYVNAYLWEVRQIKPANHGHRGAEIRADARMASCRVSYWTLQDAGYRARYVETYALAEQRARSIVDVDLRLVEATVMQALGQPIPVW
jgi:hypothetical protein